MHLLIKNVHCSHFTPCRQLAKDGALLELSGAVVRVEIGGPLSNIMDRELAKLLERRREGMGRNLDSWSSGKLLSHPVHGSGKQCAACTLNTCEEYSWPPAVSMHFSTKAWYLYLFFFPLLNGTEDQLSVQGRTFSRIVTRITWMLAPRPGNPGVLPAKPTQQQGLLQGKSGTVQLRRPGPRNKQAPVPPKRTSSFRDSTYQDRNPDDEDADEEELNNGGLERVFEVAGDCGGPEAKQSTPDTEESELHSTTSVPDVSQLNAKPQKLRKARTYPPNLQPQRAGKDVATALSTKQAKKVSRGTSGLTGGWGRLGPQVVPASWQQ